MNRICTIDNCGKRHYARGFCSVHYQHWRIHGDPLTIKKCRRVAPPATIQLPENTVAIPLTKGAVALIDAEDAARVGARIWYKGTNGYAARRVGTFIVLMHHFILQVLPEELGGKEVDHINGDKLDNRKGNLRLVDHTENMRNTARHKERKGICFCSTWLKWKAYLDRPGQKRVNLGSFCTREDAEQALHQAKVQYGLIQGD